MIDKTNSFFTQTVFKMGQRKKDEVVEFFFPFLGAEEDIAYIRKGCGCTDAYYDNGYVKGKIELAKAMNYQPGNNSVNKYITVMLNDGQAEVTADAKKRMVSNSKKTFCKLQIAATVVV